LLVNVSFGGLFSCSSSFVSLTIPPGRDWALEVAIQLQGGLDKQTKIGNTAEGFNAIIMHHISVVGLPARNF
jgi:hypothetical protein